MERVNAYFRFGVETQIMSQLDNITAIPLEFSLFVCIIKKSEIDYLAKRVSVISMVEKLRSCENCYL